MARPSLLVNVREADGRGRSSAGAQGEMEAPGPRGRSDTPFFTWVKLPRNKWRDVRVRERFAGRGRGALPTHLILDLAMSFKHCPIRRIQPRGLPILKGHHHVWPRSWHSLQQQGRNGQEARVQRGSICLWKEKAVLSGP